MVRDYGTPPQVWDAVEGCEHDFDQEVSPARHWTPGDLPSENSILGKQVARKTEVRPRPNNMASFPLNGGKNKLQELHDDTAAKLRGAAEMRPGQKSAFCSKCGAWRGQLGLEPTPDLFVRHLCDVFDRLRPALRDDGVMFINLGDTYSGSGIKINPKHAREPKNPHLEDMDNIMESQDVETGCGPKCLVGIPARFQLEMVRRGWILRNVIIWQKPGCMPSSVTDRYTIDYEYIYMLTKEPSYFFNRQFEPLACPDAKGRPFGGNKRAGGANATYSGNEYDASELVFGRNARAVWSVTTQGFKGKHFATFPPDLVRKMIDAGCPKAICKKCGKSRMNEIVAEGGLIGKSWHDHENDAVEGNRRKNKDWNKKSQDGTYQRKKVLSDCGCNAGWEPGIVLDPFMGSGTTGMVAFQEGVDWLGCELNEEYAQSALARIHSGGEKYTTRVQPKLKRLVDFAEGKA